MLITIRTRSEFKLFSEKQRLLVCKFNDVELRGAIERRLWKVTCVTDSLTVNEGRRLNERSPFEIDLADKPWRH